MLIFAAILAIFVYGMIAAMLGTILPDLSEFHLTPAQNGTIAFCPGPGTDHRLGRRRPAARFARRQARPHPRLGIYCHCPLRAPAFRRIPQHRLAAISSRCRRWHRRHRSQCPGQAVSDVHRATALNLLNLFFGLGGLATPFISANIFKRNWVRLCYTVASLTVVALIIQAVTTMPAPTAAAGFALSDAGPVLGRPLLFLLGAFLFLYVSCEVGVWNWLPRHLIAQGIPESRALNILSLGFALGLLVGRVGVSPILISVPAVQVTLAASIAMAISTFLMLRTVKPAAAAALVFIAGVSMAPVFPTVLAITGTAFPRMSGTAIGFVITCGWAGLAVSSRIIGAIAGGDPLRLKKALLLIPAFAVLMIGLNLVIWSALR